MPRMAIVHGTGLIGGSVGLALREQGWVVAGWDPDPQRLGTALDRGAIGQVLSNQEEGIDDSDLVVLAGPPDAVAKSLRTTHTETLVTDVAGVKGPIVTSGAHLAHFVGGHPMAGGITVGPEMASSQLFHGATWILTTDRAEPADLETVAEIVASVGANPVTMTAEEHDRKVAAISHLPHVVAAALVDLVNDIEGSAHLAGGGFRDLTRVASAESGWWAGLLSANAESIEPVLTLLEQKLASWRQTLGEGDHATISAMLQEAKAGRDELGEQLAQVAVVLMDRPGEIARVGRALEASKVDVRDFQLRHGEHGGGGILTISVRPGGEAKLRQALTQHEFKLLS